MTVDDSTRLHTPCTEGGEEKGVGRHWGCNIVAVHKKACVRPRMDEKGDEPLRYR
jgi:hypothetical protein